MEGGKGRENREKREKERTKRWRKEIIERNSERIADRGRRIDDDGTQSVGEERERERMRK